VSAFFFRRHTWRSHLGCPFLWAKQPPVLADSNPPKTLSPNLAYHLGMDRYLQNADADFFHNSAVPNLYLRDEPDEDEEEEEEPEDDEEDEEDEEDEDDEGEKGDDGYSE
jgi:hypothetical protein